MIDVFAGLLPVIMPAVQDRFGISMAVGITLISVLNIVCNFIQVGVGHVREDKAKPLLLPLGLLVIGSVCFIAALPEASISAWLSVPLIIITAVGIAFAHPESLRALHSINKIPPAFTSSVFLNAGFLGFASGGFIGAMLISQFGFNGLYLLLVLPVGAVALVFFTKQRLAIEIAGDAAPQNQYNIQQVNFGVVMAMAICATTAPTVLCAMIPQRLSQLGFELTFGGVTVMTFISGNVIGAFLWTALAHRKSELAACSIALPLGVPFLLVYLFMIESQWAIVFLFIAGFCSGSAYPLIVTLARYAKGFNLGRRMALVVGGAWGTASVLLWVLGPVAERIGIMPILWTMPIFYLIGGTIAMLAKTALRQITK